MSDRTELPPHLPWKVVERKDVAGGDSDFPSIVDRSGRWIAAVNPNFIDLIVTCVNATREVDEGIRQNQDRP